MSIEFVMSKRSPASLVPRHWPTNRLHKHYHVHLIDSSLAIGIVTKLVYETDLLDDARRVARTFAVDYPLCVVRIWGFREQRIMYVWS